MGPRVLRGGLALEVAGGTGEERDVVDGSRNVELRGERDGLARLGRLDLGQLLGALLEDDGQFSQRGRAVPRCGR